MTLLGRETVELSPEVLFSDIELQVLRAYAKKKDWNRHQPCETRSASSRGWRDSWPARAIQNRVTN
jgi:hypothetical protein